MAIYKGVLFSYIYLFFIQIDWFNFSKLLIYDKRLHTRCTPARVHVMSCRQQIESLGSARMDKRLGDGISFFFREPVLK